MKKEILFFLLAISGLCASLSDFPTKHEVSIVGGGIVGALESYAAYQEAEREGVRVFVTVYEKGGPFEAEGDPAPTNTAFHIVPSLTIDEILSVVPRGSELVDKLGLSFCEPGGIRVDDVEGVNDSKAAIKFIEAVSSTAGDINHEDHTETLLQLGKMSMDLWQEMYDSGDAELKKILEESNFNPCREPRRPETLALHDGYRVDLLCGIEGAAKRAENMKADYEKLGYQHCKILSPDEVVAIDPFLTDFCSAHSELNREGVREWKKDSVALWRPGGCIDTKLFLPQFYAYLKKIMGSSENRDCFQLKFHHEVVAVELDDENRSIRGLKFSDGSAVESADSDYIFCPGEAVGTLERLGFDEPAYAAFAGPSLILNIPLSEDQIDKYAHFSHCMEVHHVGIVLAWQARCIHDKIFIGVAGTKAFYGDQVPHINGDFATDRNLVQFNMVNKVLPEFISLALGYNTEGLPLTFDDLKCLEEKGIAKRWVGRRAVGYDGFPTFGPLYSNHRRIENGRCTTHLGSGGVSFGPAAVYVSRKSEKNCDDPFIKKVLRYSDSRRMAPQICSSL